MGMNGGRNLKGIEGKPEDAGLYQRVNISLPPSLMQRLDRCMNDEERNRSWCIQKALAQWLADHGY